MGSKLHIESGSRSHEKDPLSKEISNDVPGKLKVKDGPVVSNPSKPPNSYPTKPAMKGPSLPPPSTNVKGHKKSASHSSGSTAAVLGWLL